MNQLHDIENHGFEILSSEDLKAEQANAGVEEFKQEFKNMNTPVKRTNKNDPRLDSNNLLNLMY